MLIGVVGPKGSFKTTLETILSMMSGSLIYSNYLIRSPLRRELRLVEMLNLDLNNCVVCMDEGYTMIDARSSNKYVNMYPSYLLMQSRKRRVHVIVTAQLLKMIDIRFREQLDVLIKCYRHEVDEFPARFSMITHDSMTDFSISEIAIKEAWQWFDSDEVVLPVDFRVMESKILYNDPARLLKRLRELSLLFKDEKMPSSVTTVKGGLIDKEEDFSLHRELYAFMRYNKELVAV